MAAALLLAACQALARTWYVKPNSTEDVPAISVAVDFTASAEKEPQEEPIPDRTTPDNLLGFYEAAHETKNLEMYEEALHESFRLYMDSVNAKREGVRPEDAWIGKRQAVQATDMMFADVSSIGLDLIPLTEWRPYVEVEITPSGDLDTLSGMQILLDPVIRIHARDMTGEVRERDVSKSWFHVVVLPDPETPGSWVIFRILDEVDAEPVPDPLDIEGAH
jgi:hypothetical protein